MARTRTGELLRPLVTLAPSPPRLPNATKAGLTVLLCLAIPMLLGRFDLGLLTVTGTFAVLYAPAAPLRRRAATVAGIGLGLVVATALGAFTAGSYLGRRARHRTRPRPGHDRCRSRRGVAGGHGGSPPRSPPTGTSSGAPRAGRGSGLRGHRTGA